MLSRFVVLFFGFFVLVASAGPKEQIVIQLNRKTSILLEDSRITVPSKDACDFSSEEFFKLKRNQGENSFRCNHSSRSEQKNFKHVPVDGVAIKAKID